MTGDFGSDVLSMLLELLVRATVLLALAHATLSALRRSSAATRELAGRWFSVALCLLPALAFSGVSIGCLPMLESQAVTPKVEPVLDVVGVHRTHIDFEPRQVAGAPPSQPPRLWTLVAAALLAAWFAGACWFAAGAVVGHLVAARRLFGRTAQELPEVLRRDLGIGDTSAVCISTAAGQPVVAGLLRPRIAVPPAFVDWPRGRQLAVLAHERAHVERRDGVGTLLWQLARAFWWPHPLAWGLGRRLALLREQACDDRALDGGLAPTSYAAALVDVARQLRCAPDPRTHVLAMAKTSQLEARIRALLRPDAQRTRPAVWMRLASVGLPLVFGLFCGAATAVAQAKHAEPPPPPPEPEIAEPVVEDTAVLPPKPLKFGDPNAISIALTEDGKVLYAGRQIGVASVEALVTALCKRQPRQVVIQSAPEAKSGLLVRLVDCAKLGGAELVSIATPRSTPPSVPLADRRPQAVRRVQPTMSAKLRAHTPAAVTVLFIVDATGKVIEPRVSKSTDPRFDPAALQAIAKWRFTPAIRGGEPVACRLRMKLSFPRDSRADTTPPSPATETKDLDEIRRLLQALTAKRQAAAQAQREAEAFQAMASAAKEPEALRRLLLGVTAKKQAAAEASAAADVFAATLKQRVNALKSGKDAKRR